jgi:dTDP-L-rhamnose 4-epimerase
VRVLVTGGAGFIGSFVCERLLALGHTVRVLDNLDPQAHPAGEPPQIPPGVEFLQDDVRNPAACAAALENIDVVVHCAGAVGVGQSMYKVRHYIDVNVTGTATLLEALIARRSSAKLIVLTSMTGYGEGLYRRPSDGRLLRVGLRTEEDIERHGWEPVCPETHERLVPHPTPEVAALLCRNVYAFSKRYQEELSLTIGSAYAFPVVCLRLFNVYGPRQSLTNPYTGVLAIFLSRLLAGERPLVYEDGQQTRDFVSVHDVTDAIGAAIESSAADGQVLNIGSGVGRSIRDVALTLAKLTGRDDLPPVIGERYRRGDVRHCIADISRARELLGFEPNVRWEDSLTEVVEWARSSPSVDRTAQAEGELEARGLLSDRRSAPRGTT